MKRRILKMKKDRSLFEIALDIGISESSLYNYVSDYKNISNKTLNKIKDYFRRREYENITNK